MKWWKRDVFSAISLAGGFFSLDCLTFAYELLAGQRELWDGQGVPGALGQIIGAGLFLAFAISLAGYFCLIRKNASLLPIYRGEEVEKGNKRWRGPRLEMLLQLCFLVTGLVARLGYLLYIYLPKQLA